MAIKVVKIDDLKLGMFVAEMDISWIKSPFFRHKRLISKKEDIDLLRAAGVESCKIDVEKSDASCFVSKAQEIPKPQTGSRVVQAKTSPSAVAGKPLIALSKEIKAAESVRKEVIAAVDNINKSVEAGNSVHVDDVAPIVDKTIKSLERNDQALITLLHQSREHTKLSAHTFGVFTLVMLVAVDLGFETADKDQIGMGALLHDAGWSKLPNNLLGKGKTYSPAEKKLVQQHLPILEKILMASETVPEQVSTAIFQHHELCDGTGYPNQLSAHQISAWAKILCVCDIYDEMIHGLGEAPGVTPQKALSDLYQLAKQGKIDEDIARRLIKIMGVYPLGSAVLLNNQEKGIVIEVNRHEPLSPVVRVFYDAEGLPKTSPNTLDLQAIKEKGENVKVEKVLNSKEADVDPENLLVLSPKLLKSSQ